LLSGFLGFFFLFQYEVHGLLLSPAGTRESWLVHIMINKHGTVAVYFV